MIQWSGHVLPLAAVGGITCWRKLERSMTISQSMFHSTSHLTVTSATRTENGQWRKVLYILRPILSNEFNTRTPINLTGLEFTTHHSFTWIFVYQIIWLYFSSYVRWYQNELPKLLVLLMGLPYIWCAHHSPKWWWQWVYSRGGKGLQITVI